MEINGEYTQADHLGRENDRYAFFKYEETLRWLDRAGLQKGARILNVGCGAGDFNALASDKGYVVDGIEPDLEALSIAKRRSRAVSRLSNESIFDFIPEEKYDAVVIHDVLEHIEDDAGAVERLAFFLKGSESAILVASVPANQFLYGLHDEKLGHFRRYSRREFSSLISKNFEVIDNRSIGLVGIPAALYFSKWKRREYPVGKGGIGDSILRLSCKLEKHVRFPAGTSVMILGKLQSK